MTIAYWAVLAAIFVPYLFTGYAKMRGGFTPRDNRNPREFLEKLDGDRQRAHWAQMNTFEVLPAFFAAVIVAHQIGVAGQATIDTLAVAFVASRVLYGICYVTDQATLRSLVWFFGMACIVALFVVSV